MRFIAVVHICAQIFRASMDETKKKTYDSVFTQTRQAKHFIKLQRESFTMKTTTKKLITSAAAMALLAGFSSAFADVSSDAERLLNWAETKYPNIFTTHKTTKTQGPWIYRNYVESGILAGVNINDNNVYVQGGPWGNSPVVIGPLTTLMARVDATPSTGNQICDATVLPAGMTMTQNGNVITVKTDGCLVPPENQNYCEFALPEAPVATGIHVLTSGVVTNMTLTGLTGDANIINSLSQSGLDFKTCVINAPSESMANITINTDICYDLTATFAPLAGSGLITVNPPVQQRLQSTSTTTRVNDCFATDAVSVVDLVTEETWIKTNGTWNKLTTP
ncbi:MAG: hypothetical protein V4628_00145 [Pseudomonadota bacterium]